MEISKNIKLNFDENIYLQRDIKNKDLRILYNKIFPISNEYTGWNTFKELEPIIKDFIKKILINLENINMENIALDDVKSIFFIFIASLVLDRTALGKAHTSSDYRTNELFKTCENLKDFKNFKEKLEKTSSKVIKDMDGPIELPKCPYLDNDTILEKIARIIYHELIIQTDVICLCDKVIINKDCIDIKKEKEYNDNLKKEFFDFSQYNVEDDEVDVNDLECFHYECGIKYEVSSGGIIPKEQIILLNVAYEDINLSEYSCKIIKKENDFIVLEVPQKFPIDGEEKRDTANMTKHIKLEVGKLYMHETNISPAILGSTIKLKVLYSRKVHNRIIY